MNGKNAVFAWAAAPPGRRKRKMAEILRSPSMRNVFRVEEEKGLLIQRASLKTSKDVYDVCVPRVILSLSKNLSVIASLLLLPFSFTKRFFAFAPNDTP